MAFLFYWGVSSTAAPYSYSYSNSTAVEDHVAAPQLAAPVNIAPQFESFLYLPNLGIKLALGLAYFR